MNTKQNKKITVDLTENYKCLANAIVLQACMDYQSIKGNSQKDIIRKESVKDFFNSELSGLITEINPKDLINRLEKGDRITYPEKIEAERGF